MLIIGCDYHPSVQQIAWVNTETRECGERRLTHCAEAEQFYRESFPPPRSCLLYTSRMEPQELRLWESLAGKRVDD